MKIAFLSSIYPKHAEQIYRNNPVLKDKSYYEQMEFIRNDSICSIGEWPTSLKEKGYNSVMFCRNNSYLQATWCKENRFLTKYQDTEFEIILEQTKRFKPDILFIFDPSYYDNKNRLIELLEQTPSVKKKICWYGAPEGSTKIFKNYDLVLTNSIILMHRLSKEKINSQQLNHAFEPKSLELLKEKNTRINQMSFFGSLVQGNDWHKQRIENIEKIADSVPFNIFSETNELPILDQIKKDLIMSRYSISKKWVNIFPSNRFFKRYSDSKNLPCYDSSNISISKKQLFDPLFGIQMLQKLSRYSVTFNQHISHTGDYACNMRLFEATGVGTCLLTDRKKNLDELFEEDREIICYSSGEEAIEKASFLIENQKFTEKIAINGRLKTLSVHNTKNQVELLDCYIKDLF